MTLWVNGFMLYSFKSKNNVIINQTKMFNKKRPSH